MKCYLSQIIGLTLLSIQYIFAKSTENLSGGDKSLKESPEDQYYLIYVNNEHEEYKIFSDNSKNQKRQDSQLFIESLMEDIDALIQDNIDTYQNPEKLKEIENNSGKRKRTDQPLSNFVYPISSVQNRVVLYAYLSETLSQKITSKFDHIIECVPNRASFSFFHNNYNVEEILKETHWKGVSVRENAGFHLSVISQGKFEEGMVKYYDNNYYYPSSAGKDVDIIILDTSFNFNYSEFSNTDVRTVQCKGIVKNGKLTEDVSEGCNHYNGYHGEVVSVTAAGLTHGAANQANVYGIVLPSSNTGSIEEADILGGLQYVYENMIRPHKTVINLSLGGFFRENDQYFIQLKSLIDGITEKGGIVVAAAGNESEDLDNYSDYAIPCEYDHVICVGASNNGSRNTMDRAYQVIDFSNYGKNVTVYAPAYVTVEIVKKDQVVLVDKNGTSFSSPIVAGIVANMISENPEIDYTFEKARDQLLQNGKGIPVELRNGETGLLANNGKHIIYSDDSHFTKTKKRTTKTNTSTITTSTTSRKSHPTQPGEECPSKALGYPCCSHCEVIYTDEDAEWGIEYDDWCIIKYRCQEIGSF